MVEVGGVRHTLVLTLAEFTLLAQLASAPRRVFSRAELMATCLPEGDALERTVDSHVSKLRKQLDDLAPAPTASASRRNGRNARALPLTRAVRARPPHFVHRTTDPEQKVSVSELF